MATERAPRWQPDWAVHPGEVLAEALDDRGMSQAELARRMDRPLKTINEIVRGKASITHDTALQLELVLGISARLWNNLQRDYSEALARQDESRRLQADIPWVDRFPWREMNRRGWLQTTKSKPEAVGAMLRFFAVSSPTAWDRQWATAQAAFRQSTAFSSSSHAVSAWLRRGELKAEAIKCDSFNLTRLRSSLEALRQLTTLDPLAFMPELVDQLAKCGVAFVMVRELPGTHLYGAARWLALDKALIQLSLRHRTDDQFWFAIFHEIGHLMQSGPRSAFLDSTAEEPIRNHEEMVADKFSANVLIPQAEFERIRSSRKFGPADVRPLAQELGVSQGILVGRLQRERLIPPSRLNYLKQRWQWADR